MGMLLGSLVIGVLGASYAAVPLYRLFCQATGYAGTTQRGGESAETLLKRAEQVPEERKRLLTIYFVSDVSAHLPWSFIPLQSKVQVAPGEGALAFFNATNNSDKPLIGVATYNVAPSKAGVYFHKIQCFCFDEQMLEPGESVDMPVFFYVDPEFLEDPKLDGTDHITLSYTFFNSQGDDDAAMALSLIPENERLQDSQADNNDEEEAADESGQALAPVEMQTPQ